jgi:membrane protease YdiL (CAAX protease family)
MSDLAAETAAPRSPWGLWATFGWVILAILLSSIAGLIVVLIWRPDAITGGTTDMLKDGPLISITTIASAIVQVATLALAARLAHWPAGEYLGLVRPATRPALIAIAVLIVFLLGYDALTYLLGRDIVTPFQVDTYRAARDGNALPLLWLTFVLVAPIAEEIMFRGFLFRGWVRSESSAIPAIVVISLLFAAMHVVQYDWFGILQVFFIGLLLAIARWRSGSTLLTILMHALANLWATIETMIKVEWLS